MLNFLATIQAAMATTTTATCHALLRAFGNKLRACAFRLRNQSFFPAASTSSASLSVLVVLLCGATALSRVVVFFLPLVASTSICCAAVYLFVASESGGQAKEVVLLRRGAKAEVALLQVYGEANASAYGGRSDVRVGCFLRRDLIDGGWTKRGVDEDGEDGEDVVFAGRLAAATGGQDGAALEEELVALQVDRLAEGVWDSYFGGCSRWNYGVTAGCEEEIDRSSST